MPPMPCAERNLQSHGENCDRSYPQEPSAILLIIFDAIFIFNKILSFDFLKVHRRECNYITLSYSPWFQFMFFSDLFISFFPLNIRAPQCHQQRLAHGWYILKIFIEWLMLFYHLLCIISLCFLSPKLSLSHC